MEKKCSHSPRSGKVLIYRYSFPIIGILGPRQSGKTTLAKNTFAELPYVNLEELAGVIKNFIPRNVYIELHL